MSGFAIRSACPTCGVVAVRNTYDIGSGPELSCSNCEWCWGANGQDLKPLEPLTFADIQKRIDEASSDEQVP